MKVGSITGVPASRSGGVTMAESVAGKRRERENIRKKIKSIKSFLSYTEEKTSIWRASTGDAIVG